NTGVVNTPISQVDLSATVTDLARVKHIQPNDSVSFAGIVLHPNDAASRGPVFAEYALGTAHAKYMVRDGEWKYTFWLHDREELYDLHEDPEELHNVADEARCRPQADRLKALLFAWHRPALA
ncbi:MAG: sulfatase/phosphatase domain-containing protein, partial [Terriglobus sp.]